jgi:hypothetical protein
LARAAFEVLTYFSELYNSLQTRGRRKSCGNEATTSPFISLQQGLNQEGDSMSSKEQASQPAGQHPTPPPAQGSEHAFEPSGPKGDNPATAGPGPTKIQSGTPENRLGRINPSAPEDANTTPGTTHEK